MRYEVKIKDRNGVEVRIGGTPNLLEAVRWAAEARQPWHVNPATPYVAIDYTHDGRRFLKLAA